MYRNMIALVLILAVAAGLGACTSRSEEQMNNKVIEKCVVMDSYTVKDTGENRHNEYILWKVRRVSDNTIHNRKLIWNMLYETGDTILIDFDKRYHYETKTFLIMTLADKEGKLLNHATIIANLKGDGSQINENIAIVHDPNAEQLRLAYVNSDENSIRGVSNDGIVSLNFSFKDKSSLILKIGADAAIKEQ